MNPPRRYVLAASVVALLVVAPEAIAQTYPSHPVTMIVPASAGGPTDAIARVLSERMTANLGGTVLVDNVAGAGLSAPPLNHAMSCCACWGVPTRSEKPRPQIATTGLPAWR